MDIFSDHAFQSLDLCEVFNADLDAVFPNLDAAMGNILNGVELDFFDSDLMSSNKSSNSLIEQDSMYKSYDFWDSSYVDNQSDDSSNRNKRRKTKKSEDAAFKKLQDNILMPMPYRESSFICVGVSHAFNCGDAYKIVELLQKSCHTNVVLRVSDDISQFQATGIDKIVKYYQRLSHTFPDGVMSIKKSTPGKVNGYGVIRNAFTLTGTPLPSVKKICASGGNVSPSYEMIFEGASTVYLDKEDRIIVVEYQVKSMMKSRPWSGESSNLKKRELTF